MRQVQKGQAALDQQTQTPFDAAAHPPVQPRQKQYACRLRCTEGPTGPWPAVHLGGRQAGRQTGMQAAHKPSIAAGKFPAGWLLPMLGCCTRALECRQHKGAAQAASSSRGGRMLKSEPPFAEGLRRAYSRLPARAPGHQPHPPCSRWISRACASSWSLRPFFSMSAVMAGQVAGQWSERGGAGGQPSCERQHCHCHSGSARSTVCPPPPPLPRPHPSPDTASVASRGMPWPSP